MDNGLFGVFYFCMELEKLIIVTTVASSLLSFSL